MKIAMGSDHGGFDLKKTLKERLRQRGIEVEDVGCNDKSSVDYPDYVGAAAELVSDGRVERGVVICTTGIGASIVANKYPGVRAALCTTPKMAEMSRRHNNANVLALGANNTSIGTALQILDSWLECGFEGGRHERRVSKIGAASQILTGINILDRHDRDIGDVIKSELHRKERSLNLIASENCSSSAVQASSGSLLMDKYASGYPSARHYPGCENVDEIECIARERLAALFGAEHANVQCYSGSSANMAVYLSVLDPGDTILSMSPDTGGHVTQGGVENMSGKLYEPVHYTLDRETGLINYDEVENLARKHKPKLICVGDSLYPRFIDFKRFRSIADNVGAYLMADIAHTAGLVVAGCYPNPAPYCEFVTLTTHKTMRGPRGGAILCQKRFSSALNKSVYPGCQGGPLMNMIAAKGVCFYEASLPEFQDYQHRVTLNAKKLADAMENGALPLLTGGTDTHMMTCDISKYCQDPQRAVASLEKVGLLVNGIDIKFEPDAPASPYLRIGTSEITARGMGTEEMPKVYKFLERGLNHIANEKRLQALRNEVAEFMRDFPLR